jgi:hypothetical protein
MGGEDGIELAGQKLTIAQSGQPFGDGLMMNGPGEGVERIMWGSDYPHSEGSYPYRLTALRAAFGTCDPAETRLMLEDNVARVYGFDLESLRPIGDRIGPSVAQLATPLAIEGYPTDSTCNAFDRHQVLRSW